MWWFCVQLNRILRFAYSFVSECLSFVDECVKPLFNQFAEESFFVRTFLSTHPAISVYCLLYLFVTIVCNVFLRKVYSIINNKQQKKSTSAEQKSFSLNLIVNNFNTIQNVVADSYPTLNRNCAPINVDSKALHDSSNSDKEVSLHLPTVLQKEIALLEPIASLLPAVYEFPSFDLTPTEFIPQILKQIYINVVAKYKSLITKYLLDSGAAISIVNDKSLLRNVKHTNARIAGFDGKPTLADGIGTLSILGMELECLYVKKCKENILSIRDLTNHGRTVCFVNNKTFILPTANLQDNEIQDHLSKFANEQHQQNKLINSSSNDKSDVYRAVLRANLNNPSHYFIKALHEQNIN